MACQGFYERVSGIEPPSLPWQGSVIATIRHPQRTKFPGNFYVAETFKFCKQNLFRLAMVPWAGHAPATSSFSETRSTT